MKLSNLLDCVAITKTFRVKSTNLQNAAIAVSANLSRATVSRVDPVLCEENTFLVISTIGDTVYRDVVFVETIKEGLYRVDVTDTRLTEFQATWLIGGDKAINEIGFYKSDREEINTAEYLEKIEFWRLKDIKENTPNRMESHIKESYKKVVMSNGIFI